MTEASTTTTTIYDPTTIIATIATTTIVPSFLTDDDDNYYNEALYSKSQYYMLIITSSITSGLSVLGSLSIAISSYRRCSFSTYQRLIFVISFFDGLSSLSLLLHHVLMPRYTRQYGLYIASGNMTTCSIIGFWIYLGPLMVSFYSFYLSYYFYAKVRYNTLDSKIQQSYQIPANIIAVVVSFGIPITGLFLHGYRPRPFWNICFFGVCQMGIPGDCTTNLMTSGPVYALAFAFSIVVMMLAILSVITTIALYRTVSKNLSSNAKYHFRGHQHPTNHHRHNTTNKTNNSNLSSISTLQLPVPKDQLEHKGEEEQQQHANENDTISGGDHDDDDVANQENHHDEKDDTIGGDDDDACTNCNVTKNINNEEKLNNDDDRFMKDRTATTIRASSSSLCKNHNSSNQWSNSTRNTMMKTIKVSMRIISRQHQDENDHDQQQVEEDNDNQRQLHQQQYQQQKRQQHNHLNSSRMIQVRNQALMYAVVYWNSFFWIFLVFILGGNGSNVNKEIGPDYMTLAMLCYLFFPLQGFLNFFVYTRPRYMEYRRLYPHQTRWRSFLLSLTLEAANSNTNYRHHHHHPSANRRGSNSSSRSHSHSYRDVSDSHSTHDLPYQRSGRFLTLWKHSTKISTTTSSSATPLDTTRVSLSDPTASSSHPAASSCPNNDDKNNNNTTVDDNITKVASHSSTSETKKVIDHDKADHDNNDNHRKRTRMNDECGSGDDNNNNDNDYPNRSNHNMNRNSRHADSLHKKYSGWMDRFMDEDLWFDTDDDEFNEEHNNNNDDDNHQHRHHHRDDNKEDDGSTQFDTTLTQYFEKFNQVMKWKLAGITLSQSQHSREATTKKPSLSQSQHSREATTKKTSGSNEADGESSSIMHPPSVT